MFCRRKSKESRLLDRIALRYGEDCVIYYGDWSRTDQMKGCDPAPAKGMRDLVGKRFAVKSTCRRVQDVKDVQQMPRTTPELQKQVRKLHCFAHLRDALQVQNIHGQRLQRSLKHTDGKSICRETSLPEASLGQKHKPVT